MAIVAAHGTAVNKMLCRIITMILVVGVVSIHCYPLDREGRPRSTTDSNRPVIMSNTVRDLLINVNNTTTSNKGLTEVYISAEYLVKDELYTPEVYSYIYMHSWI